MMTAERNRRRQLTQPRLVRTVDQVLATLQLQLISPSIPTSTRRSAPRRPGARREELLTTAPAISAKIARTLIADLPELGALTRRRITALVGCCPVQCDGGKRHGKRAIAGGRSSVRAALYMAVLVAIRRKHTLAATYQRLRAAGKPAKLALIAAMRKLLIHSQRHHAGQDSMARHLTQPLRPRSRAHRQCDVRQTGWSTAAVKAESRRRRETDELTLGTVADQPTIKTSQRAPLTLMTVARKLAELTSAVKVLQRVKARGTQLGGRKRLGRPCA